MKSVHCTTVVAAVLLLCLSACRPVIVEPMAYGRYYVDNRTDSALVVSAEALYGQADLLTDSLQAQSITAIDDVVQGSGGHVLPSNFYRGFAVTFVDSMGNASVLYSGVRNEDWERVSTIADRTELILVID
ncbi:MAG: hypothetical protein IPJ76_01290 [Flavobacteriales bacterium]|nr:MAG: hypothetical protein IPJ76_01290 [Flavobacteriales bacterium]